MGNVGVGKADIWMKLQHHPSAHTHAEILPLGFHAVCFPAASISLTPSVLLLAFMFGERGWSFIRKWAFIWVMITSVHGTTTVPRVHLVSVNTGADVFYRKSSNLLRRRLRCFPSALWSVRPVCLRHCVSSSCEFSTSEWTRWQLF